MHWQDDAIILSLRKHGEHAGLVRMLTHTHGVVAGLVRGVAGTRNRGIYHAGNQVTAGWNARLAEHLGTVSAELITPNAALCMTDPLRLTVLSAACAMVERLLPERQPAAEIYTMLCGVLEALRHAQASAWMSAYVWLEMELLRCSGFGLDLRRCAATGTQAQLVYVSPKSGHAVSREAGLPYHDRMLALPEFLRDHHTQASVQEVREGLRLTGYFLQERVFTPHGWKFPAARHRLFSLLTPPPVQGHKDELELNVSGA